MWPWRPCSCCTMPRQVGALKKWNVIITPSLCDRQISIFTWCRHGQIIFGQIIFAVLFNLSCYPAHVLQVGIILFLLWWFYEPIKKWAVARPFVCQLSCLSIYACMLMFVELERQINWCKQWEPTAICFSTCLCAHLNVRYKIAHATYSKAGILSYGF